jgi:peptide/nickel transport system permease protein
MSNAYLAHAARRIAQAGVVVLLAYVLTFVVVSILPGDPVTNVLRNPQNGFTEAENAGGEPFGATGLEQALLDSPRAGRVNSLCAALTRHLGSQTATDDVSWLILDCASPGEGTG